MMFWWRLFDGKCIVAESPPTSNIGRDSFIRDWGALPLCNDGEDC